jgi:hypothetical protein
MEIEAHVRPNKVMERPTSVWTMMDKRQPRILFQQLFVMLCDEFWLMLGRILDLRMKRSDKSDRIQS